MSRAITDMLHIFPSIFKIFRLLEAKSACYFVPPAKMFAGEPMPTKLSCFILKNILKPQHEKAATLHSRDAVSKPCSFKYYQSSLSLRYKGLLKFHFSNLPCCIEPAPRYSFFLCPNSLMP